MPYGLTSWLLLPSGREQLLASLDELREQQPGLATVLVTHHLEELPATTSHALLLRGGQMLAAGPASEVLTTELGQRLLRLPGRDYPPRRPLGHYRRAHHLTRIG